MTQSYLAQGLKQSRFLSNYIHVNPGSNRVAVIFELSRLSLHSEASKRARCFYASRSSALVELIWNYAFPARSFALCSTTISRGSDYLPSTSHCWQTWSRKSMAIVRYFDQASKYTKQTILSPFPTFEIEQIEIHWRDMADYN